MLEKNDCGKKVGFTSSALYRYCKARGIKGKSAQVKDKMELFKQLHNDYMSLREEVEFLKANGLPISMTTLRNYIKRLKEEQAAWWLSAGAIILAYCSRILSSDLRYELGLPIFTPSSLHLAMYCALPLLIRSMMVRRSICAISKRMVQMSEVTGLTLPSSVRVSSLI